MLMQCIRWPTSWVANPGINRPAVPTQHSPRRAIRRLTGAAAPAAADTALLDSQAAPAVDEEDGGRLGLVRTICHNRFI